MLWEVDIHPKNGQPNREAERAAADIRALHLAEEISGVVAARGYLLQGESLTQETAQRLADELLVDRVVETAVVAPVGSDELNAPNVSSAASSSSSETNVNDFQLIHVLPKPGVMDPVAQSTLAAIADFDVACDAVRTFRKYWIPGVSRETLGAIRDRVLANDAIEQAIIGPLALKKLDAGSAYAFEKKTIALAGLDDDALMRLSREGQLYLQLAEMRTIQAHFAEIGRDPTDIELETIAQTWSEHCSHKTLAGRIAYRDERGERRFENMLKETIFAATQTIRAELGDDDWCVSVFKDNAGVIRFDETHNLAFKVETHNHPSALEPYGGANTGVGGVLRDIMGTGLGAKPIAATDVFCFAPPERTGPLPPGVLHPKRVMRGVVEGVRDYGNRMGVPTVNGAICFDERYLGNPLVYCGSVGVLPRDKSFGEPRPGDKIVVLGGRTGRDGIHGATFSSAELTSESEGVSGGAVQIGNAIEEKKVLDVMLAARDEGLYNAVTDCGAGGFSSAVGEMGEEIGAEVWLDRAPLKYDGLSYTEIWISEAQERMVFAVPPKNVDRFIALSASEGVEAFVLGKFTPNGRLVLSYGNEIVGDLSMEFLHDGRPPVVREAVWSTESARETATATKQPSAARELELEAALLAILGSLNVASKEWVIRQYDHEVLGGSVVKPLVGAAEDGPGDAAVIRPVLGSDRAVAIACAINPRYGDLDPARMAASAIDEAIRNCVAVGANPARIALLDNFCWGDCERPETLGGLVRAAIACHDTAVAMGTPFISGKDSLNNEFSYVDETTGERRTIAIPATLLISAIGQIDDAATCVTMDLKTPGDRLYLVGETKNELGGSHYHLVTGELGEGAEAPSVDLEQAKTTFARMHAAITAGHVRACHDLSEGGLAVAAAEMCFAGGLGALIELTGAPVGFPIEGADDAFTPRDITTLLFSESNTRFLCEVPEASAAAFEATLAGVPCAQIGTVTDSPELTITANQNTVIESNIETLKSAWQTPLAW